MCCSPIFNSYQVDMYIFYEVTPVTASLFLSFCLNLWHCTHNQSHDSSTNLLAGLLLRNAMEWLYIFYTYMNIHKLYSPSSNLKYLILKQKINIVRKPPEHSMTLYVLPNCQANIPLIN